MFTNHTGEIMNKKLMLLALLAMGAVQANETATPVANAEPTVATEETIAAAEAPAEEAVQTNEKSKEKEKGCGCKR